MTNLKKLGAAIVLLLAFGLTAFADCPIPGQIETPPCTSAAQTAPDDSTAPGIMQGPPVSEAPSVELPSLAEIVLDILF